jgi:hypothetical protein
LEGPALALSGADIFSGHQALLSVEELLSLGSDNPVITVLEEENEAKRDDLTDQVEEEDNY